MRLPMGASLANFTLVNTWRDRCQKQASRWVNSSDVLAPVLHYIVGDQAQPHAPRRTPHDASLVHLRLRILCTTSAGKAKAGSTCCRPW